MHRQLTAKEIIGWDVKNWSEALKYWEKLVSTNNKLECLEIGANKGGISLWLASKGHHVVCNDLHPVSEETLKYHSEFSLKGKIEYQSFDAAQIPFENYFDIIILKSVMGGIGRAGRNDRIEASIQAIYKALKPGGMFLFAENLQGSRLHKFFRKKFVSWSQDWNYIQKKQLEKYLECFKETEIRTTGFAGAFGFNEVSRNLLGNLDSIFFNKLPESYHYIIYGHAKK